MSHALSSKASALAIVLLCGGVGAIFGFNGPLLNASSACGICRACRQKKICWPHAVAAAAAVQVSASTRPDSQWHRASPPSLGLPSPALCFKKPMPLGRPLLPEPP